MLGGEGAVARTPLLSLDRTKHIVHDAKVWDNNYPGSLHGLLLRTSGGVLQRVLSVPGLGGEQSLDIQERVPLLRKPVRSRRTGFLF